MADIKERLRLYEGSLDYQKHLGYYRNGKFYPYKDSLGYPTVGYGHLIQKGEDFSNGITPIEADILLAHDIEKAKAGLRTLNLGTLPKDIEDYLIIMIFQLGLGGTSKFKKILAAAKKGDREGIRRESKDSLWYKQTKSRVDDMNNQLNWK
ncbi:TPA: glycoside hydrolase family protein [Enterobacter cloacae]|uniref:glycoside hydrolase family protein n=1 Tax=Enterobacter cloacae TaxID=550 RepID=UPI00296D03AE|nr:glycoside hydrolase family protein [Enterobacter cloacae]HAS1066447.1 glycoside hydrolase family protein [Enterobacter cloacae]HAS1116581.1 glycoside hydrolase family protein [Enterobacter cloacae]HAS1132579.1 glycoside hydrolase family protein [Enterobacter cloacae]HAS1162103.1 glycoside hydrolase family protein [Enterobacter cloacae]